MTHLAWERGITQDWPQPGPEPTCSRSSQGFRPTEPNESLLWADRTTEAQRWEGMPRTEELQDSYRPRYPDFMLHRNCSSPSHAIPSSQVPVHKLLLCQVLHAAGYLQAEADEVLHRWILGAQVRQ